MKSLIECQITAKLLDPLEEFLCSNAELQWIIYQEFDEEPVLRGYFESEQAAVDSLTEIRNRFLDLSEEYQITKIVDQDWQNIYKTYLQPWSHGKLHWVPDWLRNSYQLPDNAIAVYVDAGMAFGTGMHETTRLMARRLLEFYEFKGKKFSISSIMDVGCGSGILSISAYKLGNTNVRGFDIDADVLKVCQENLERNNLQFDSLKFNCANITNGLKNWRADLILANILADVLMAHAKILITAVKPLGWLVLGGILAKELLTIKHYFTTIAKVQWGSLQIKSRVDSEWADLCLGRPA